MAQQTISAEKKTSFNWLTAVLLVVPLILLGAVIALFLSTGGGLQLAAPAPVVVGEMTTGIAVFCGRLENRERIDLAGNTGQPVS